MRMDGALSSWDNNDNNDGDSLNESVDGSDGGSPVGTRLIQSER